MVCRSNFTTTPGGQIYYYKNPKRYRMTHYRHTSCVCEKHMANRFLGHFYTICIYIYIRTGVRLYNIEVQNIHPDGPIFRNPPRIIRIYIINSCLALGDIKSWAHVCSFGDGYTE